MTRRKQLQDMIRRIKEDRSKVIKGCPWREAENIFHLYSEEPGTMFSGTDRIIKNIDDRLATAERDLAALPKPSALEEAKYAFEYCGATNETTKEYIKALEKCRPWVIRNRRSGGLWLACIGGFVSSVSFLSKHDADEFLDKEITQKSEWEVVQWEGEE